MQHAPDAITLPLREPPVAILGPAREIAWRSAPPADAGLASLVRAGSAIRRWRDAYVVVQDDVRALAILDDATLRAGPRALATPLLLPAGPGGARTYDDSLGNKHAKLDLEAAVVLPDGRLLVVGSGATRARERLVLVDSQRARIVDASALYAGLRAHASLRDATTNLEAAVIADERLRLFQRGVGMFPHSRTRAPRPPSGPAVNAILDLDLTSFLRWLDHGAAPPHPERVTLYDLGIFDGAVIGFTDAALLQDGRVAFLACAELTGDPVLDGRVVATRFGVLDGAAGWQSRIVDERGATVLDKLEGLEPDDRPGTFHVVSDADDPAAPARIAGLAIRE